MEQSQFRTRLWSLIAVCASALALGGCLQSSDDANNGNATGERSQANGGYYASMLPTAAQGLVHALNAYVADKHTIPTGATTELKSLITSGLTSYGFDLTKMGSASALMRNAYCGTHLIAWVDPSTMDAETKATYVAELAKRSGESSLGTISADGKTIALKDGHSVSVDGCAPAALKADTTVLAFGITYPADMAAQAVSYNTRDVTCDTAGMTGYVGTATQRQAVHGDGTTDTTWTNYDTSKCALGFKVGSNVSKTDVSMNSQNAMLGGSVAALLVNAPKGVKCINHATTVEVEEAKKDADGKVVLDDKGNPVLEKVTKTIDTCASGAATTIVAQTTKTQDTAESKTLNCGDGAAEARANDTYAGVAFAYDPARWTGTFTAKRTKTIGTTDATTTTEADLAAKLAACISNPTGANCTTSYSEWTGDTIACTRNDTGTVPCSAFTPAGYTIADGTNITLGHQLIANTFANPATFTPAVQTNQWTHTGGTCTYQKVTETDCPAGSEKYHRDSGGTGAGCLADPANCVDVNREQAGTYTITAHRKSYQNGALVDLPDRTQTGACYKPKAVFCPNGVWYPKNPIDHSSLLNVENLEGRMSDFFNLTLIGGTPHIQAVLDTISKIEYKNVLLFDDGTPAPKVGRFVVLNGRIWISSLGGTVSPSELSDEMATQEIYRFGDSLFGNLTVQYESDFDLGRIFVRRHQFVISGVGARQSCVMSQGGIVSGIGASHDPLVLDMSGKGINLTDVANGVAWDINEDGVADQAAWIGKGTGLLVRDKNSDGKITDQSELFGNKDVLGFDMLAQLDDNHDGVIDAQDLAYSTLEVWQDANGDAVSDAGEVKKLSDLGITDISLKTTKVDETVAGNKITEKANFTMNGVAHTIAEAFFNFIDGVKNALK